MRGWVGCVFFVFGLMEAQEGCSQYKGTGGLGVGGEVVARLHRSESIGIIIIFGDDIMKMIQR